MNHSEDWEKRKKELLDEYHTMQEMKEEKQKKKGEASTTDMKRPFVVFFTHCHIHHLYCFSKI